MWFCGLFGSEEVENIKMFNDVQIKLYHSESRFMNIQMNTSGCDKYSEKRPPNMINRFGSQHQISQLYFHIRYTCCHGQAKRKANEVIRMRQ